MSHRVNKLMLGFFSLMFLSATILFGASKYEEKVAIPKYNPNNPTHVLITPSNGKWNRYVLNDPNKKHFYVKPGKYSSKYINLTRSGTKSSRRTMSLYNGNNLHPAALPDNQVANVWFHFNGADYWTIDRMANLDRNVNPSMRFINGATHNIINRWHLRNFKYGALIGPNCNYNTIQNSYINGATASALRTIDAIGLDIYTDVKGSVIGTKLINNDIRNATDGIQTTNNLRKLSKTDANFEGTIIDNNRIWRDSDSYTDRNGNPDPKGGYLYGENAINLKAGSDNPKNPIVITNNIMWGYKTDLMVMRPATPFVSQTSVKNVKMSDNIIAESLTGAVIMSSYNWEFDRNIFYDISMEDPENKKRTMLYVSISKQLSLKNNTFVNTSTKRQGSGWSLYIHQQAQSDTFNNNVFVNVPKAGGTTSGHKFNNNWFYNTKESLPGKDNHPSSSIKTQMGDYTFTYERFTGKFKTKKLQGVVTTKNSPHFNSGAGSSREGKSLAASVASRHYLLPEIIIFSIF